MAKKKQHTFADEAKALQKRFPRRETDPIEKRDYQESMMRLMQEQELARQQMGLDQPQEEFKGGGKMKYPDGGYHSRLPSDFEIQSAIQLGPALRGQNLNMPVADLTGVQPGYTEVDVIGDRNAPIRRKYNQPGYTPEMKGFPGPATPQFNKPVKTPDFNTPAWSANRGQSQYLTPQQLASMGEPWERPATPATSIPSTNVSTRTQSTQAVPSTTREQINMSPMQSIGTPRIGPGVPDQSRLTVQDPGKGTFAPQEGFMDKYGEYMPYAASGLANIASNLLLANQAGRNVPRVTPNIGSPERINMEPQANALRDQATTARNIAIANARNAGVNPGSVLANIGAASAAIDRGLGQNLTNLYMGQEQANVGAANQYGLANMQSTDRANMFNAQARAQAQQDQLGYLGAAMGTIPGVMKDIRMDRADKRMQDVMQSYYNSMGRNYMVEGDLFTDPESGFKYKVRNNELIKVG